MTRLTKPFRAAALAGALMSAAFAGGLQLIPGRAEAASTSSILSTQGTSVSNTNITPASDCAAGSMLTISFYDDSGHVVSGAPTDSKGNTYSTPVSSILSGKKLYTSRSLLASSLTIAGGDWIKYQLTTNNGTYADWVLAQCTTGVTGVDHEGDGGTDNATNSYTFTTATGTAASAGLFTICSTGGWTNEAGGTGTPTGWTLVVSSLSGGFGCKVFSKSTVAAGASETQTLSPWTGGEAVVGTYELLTLSPPVVHGNSNALLLGVGR